MNRKFTSNVEAESEEQNSAANAGPKKGIIETFRGVI